MDLIPWFPSITTTGLFAVALWLGREIISTRLTKSVQHEFDEKLESIKAELRASEERFKAELREKEAEISALRSGALTVLASRQAAVDKRRLEAVDQLWSSFNALAPTRAIATFMACIKFESAAMTAEKNPKFRQIFELIAQGFDIKSVDLTGADKARPFLSPMVWATYAAIRAISLHSVMQLQILKGGLGSNDFADHKAIQKLLLAALPHYSAYIDKHGPSVYYYALEALDEKLLAEVQCMLSGSDVDKDSLQQAAEIIRQANALQSADLERELEITTNATA